MINADKVKLMSRISLYENNEGREAIEYNNYCREHRFLKRWSRNLPSGLLLSVMICGAVPAIFPEIINSAGLSLGIAWSAVLCAAMIALITSVYCVFCEKIIFKRFDRIRTSLIINRLRIRHLNEFTKEK